MPDRRFTQRTARRRQHEFWEPLYASPPADEGESPLARWAERWLSEDSTGDRALELGYGLGRDLGLLLRHRYTVAGVELSRTAAAHARRRSLELPRPDGLPRPILDTGDAGEFLATQPDGSAGLVYSNLFLSMALPPAAERKLWGEIARVLRPGGLHVYSVRSTSDPWFGQGARRGVAVFDPGEEGPPLRFFSRPELERRVSRRYEPLDRHEGSEGEGRYARSMIYGVDRRKNDGGEG